MRIGLLGGHGQFGSEFRRRASGHEIIAPNSAELDIRDPEALLTWVKETQADAWINAAAYTAVDKAEDEADAAHAVNVQGARNLSQALKAAQFTTPLIYLSTDYVFDGNKSLTDTPYQEQDATNPGCVYGATKLAGESETLGYSNAFVIRVSWVFGQDGHNFVKAIMRHAMQRDEEFARTGSAEPLRVVDDQYGAPCSTVSISEVLLSLLASPPTPGVYHFANTPHTNWYEFSQAILDEAKQLGLIKHPVEVVTQPTSALNQKARRPPDGRLDASRLNKALQLPAFPWRDELRVVLQNI